MAQCDNCMANKVCDHNRFGFENCGNYIPTADVAPRAEVAMNIFEEIERLFSRPFTMAEFDAIKKKYTEVHHDHI